MLKITKEFHGNKGKVRSLETRRLLSEIQKGKVLSEATKKKVSETMKKRFASGEIVNKGRKWKESEKEKARLSHKGEINYLWKGESAKPITKHLWLTRWYGKPKECEHCGILGKKIGRQWNIQWANIDHLYKRDRKDYIPLCRKCHNIFDGKSKIINNIY